MTYKYYWEEHEYGYRRAEREGLAGWNELHGGRGFENFSSRAFLEQALPVLDLPASPAETDVLEYGCGTGPGACFLAARGFRVDAVDLSPTAIKLARRCAAARGLTIRFEVQDVCEVANRPPAKRYDVIVDSYCLQSVVTDEDRARLYAFVRARLKPTGYYLISTAMFDPDRAYEDHDHYDQESGVVYDRVCGDPDRYEGAVPIDGTWWLPNRRHLTPPALRRELEGAGFRVLWQGGRLGGDVLCVHHDGSDRLNQPMAAASAGVACSTLTTAVAVRCRRRRRAHRCARGAANRRAPRATTGCTTSCPAPPAADPEIDDLGIGLIRLTGSAELTVEANDTLRAAVGRFRAVFPWGSEPWGVPGDVQPTYPAPCSRGRRRPAAPAPFRRAPPWDSACPCAPPSSRW
jgi:SAM-dependent methyltransferase